MQQIVDPCKIIKNSIIEYLEKDIDSDKFFVEYSPNNDTKDMQGFWVGFKEGEKGFVLRVNKNYTEDDLKSNAFGVVFQMNKPEFKIE